MSADETKVQALGNEILAVLCPEWGNASLVLDAADSSVLFANSACIRMLRQEALISIVGNRLQFQDQDLNRQFHLQLASLLKSEDERAFVMWRDLNASNWLSIMIRHDQGFFRDAVDVRLGRRHASQLVVIEFTSSNDQPDPAALASFARTAGLSPAELELLHLIASGRSVSEAAVKRDASVTTVRQQMKSILAKTGCRRQSELMALIYSLCPHRNV